MRAKRESLLKRGFRGVLLTGVKVSSLERWRGEGALIPGVASGRGPSKMTYVYNGIHVK